MMTKTKDGLRPQTLGAILILLAITIGIFLPWYSGMSLLSVIVGGLSASGSLGALGAMLDFGAMSSLITAIFVLLALMTVGSIAFGVRTVVTSFGARPKGMTPCGLLIFVIAAAAFAVVLVVGSVGSVQPGLWLCLIAGLASLLWGIFA